MIDYYFIRRIVVAPFVILIFMHNAISSVETLIFRNSISIHLHTYILYNYKNQCKMNCIKWQMALCPKTRSKETSPFFSWSSFYGCFLTQVTNTQMQTDIHKLCCKLISDLYLLSLQINNTTVNAKLLALLCNDD